MNTIEYYIFNKFDACHKFIIHLQIYKLEIFETSNYYLRTDRVYFSVQNH